MCVHIDPASRLIHDQVGLYAPSRVGLAPQFTEIERAREKFLFTYLPQEVEALFKEALACFSAGAFNAFASMFRRTAQAVFAGKLRVFDGLNITRDLAGLPAQTYGKLKALLFGSEADPRLGLSSYSRRRRYREAGEFREGAMPPLVQSAASAPVSGSPRGALPAVVICSLDLMLMDSALERIALARHCMEDADGHGTCRLLTGAAQIVGELRSSLNVRDGGPFAANLDDLCDYMSRQLVAADRDSRVETLDEVSHLLREVRTAWVIVPPETRRAKAAATGE